MIRSSLNFDWRCHLSRLAMDSNLTRRKGECNTLNLLIHTLSLDLLRRPLINKKAVQKVHLLLKNSYLLIR